MTAKHIYVVPIEFDESYLLTSLCSSLTNTFSLPTYTSNITINTSLAYDPLRNQYNSSDLLTQLIYNSPADVSTILGVCSFDLFIPILTFVFGEAQLEGIGAIVSTCRLKNEYYGGAPDIHSLTERLVKEAIHEIGHTYGLYHCHYPGCVMNNSIYVEDVDEKSGDFCDACEALLTRNGNKDFLYAKR